eukprot:1727337-Karenia_brevis.AAC.1
MNRKEILEACQQALALCQCAPAASSEEYAEFAATMCLLAEHVRAGIVAKKVKKGNPVVDCLLRTAASFG